LGCTSGIPQLSQTRTAKAFRAFPKALTTSFPIRSNQQAFHEVVTCRTASVSASDDVFTWEDVVRISKPVQISGATRDVLFCYDLKLPEPRNQDRKVESFKLISVTHVANIIRSSQIALLSSLIS
ncbi:unnamed protein product, partial [Prunus brigantina]